MGPFFRKKTLNMGTFLGKKLPLNMGMGPDLPAAYPRPIQIWEPTPPGGNNTLEAQSNATF